jgi:hypothetical protein
MVAGLSERGSRTGLIEVLVHAPAVAPSRARCAAVGSHIIRIGAHSARILAAGVHASAPTRAPMTAGAIYDTIGRGYREFRRPDPRIAAAIWTALGDASSVVNVGAGTGSYEPADRELIAVEPSAVMIAQRPAGAAPAIRTAAEALPLQDQAVEAAMAVPTVQHWGDVD